MRTIPVLVALLVFATAAASNAQCPDPVPVDFSEVPDVLPYGDAPRDAVDTMFGQFIFPWVNDLAVPPPPWEVEGEGYYCEHACGYEPGGWQLVNRCPNIADESIADEMADPTGPDWYRTSGSDPSYNCLAWTFGRQDEWIWEECDPEDPRSSGPFTPAQLQTEFVLYPEYRPSEHCFPECGKRKAVALGKWFPDYRAGPSIAVVHVFPEVGDRSEAHPELGNWWESKFGKGHRVLHRFWDIAGGCFDYGGPIMCWERDEPDANPDLCDPEYDPFEDPANQVPPGICERWGTENYLFCRDEFCDAWGEEACPPEDPDLDGIPFPLDSCPEDFDLGVDTDLDGVDDACDNCIDEPNPGQDNCDPQWDESNPEGLRGDLCDPDPCTEWRFNRDHRPVRTRREFVLHGERLDAEDETVADFWFGTVGGEMDDETRTYPEGGIGDEAFYRVQAAYCSCAQAVDEAACDEACNKVGRFEGSFETGAGWFLMNRVVEDGRILQDPIPDVHFRRRGSVLGDEHFSTWAFEENACPGLDEARIDCGLLFPQDFRVWLRPLVPADWPTGWPEDEHNFYADGEFNIRPVLGFEPFPEEMLDVERRLVPEQDCIVCDLAFLGERLVPFVGELIPDPDSPFRFAGAGPDDPVQGLGVGFLDPFAFTVRAFLPSEGLTTFDEPRVTNAAAAVVPGALPSDLPTDLPDGPYGDATLWFFGGVDATGLPTDALFRGMVVPGATLGDDRVVWERVYSSGPVPPGREGAVLAYDRHWHSLVLFGGLGEDRALGDLWRFDLSSGEWWQEVPFTSDVFPGPGRRGLMAHAQRGPIVYLYGGVRDDGALDDGLYRLNLVNGHMRFLDLSGVPGPRARAGLAVEADGRGLLLYGGVGPSGPLGDLWRFDLRRSEWRRLVASCTGGPCAPPGEAGLVAGPMRESAVVIPSIGTEVRPEPLWFFDRTASRSSPPWVPYGEWAGSPDAGDCDGDGYLEPELATVCATSPDWFSEPSLLGCDLEGALGCPEVATDLVALHTVRARPGSVFAARGTTVVLASGHDLVRLRVTPGETPTTIATSRLAGRATGVVLNGEYAFVGTTRGIEAFSLHAGDLAFLGRRDVGGRIAAMSGDGLRLYVVAGRSLLVLDSSDPDLQELGRAALPNAGVSALALLGHHVAIAAAAELLLVSTEGPTGPEVVGSVRVRGGTKALRARGRRVYGVKRSGATYVVDVSDPSLPTVVGAHDVEAWTRGAAFLPDFAVRLARRDLEIAEIAR